MLATLGTNRGDGHLCVLARMQQLSSQALSKQLIRKWEHSRALKWEEDDEEEEEEEEEEDCRTEIKQT